MRVLIVGCGYVGLPLGKELARQGHAVFGLRRSALAETEMKAAGIMPLHADITRPESLAKLPRDFDWVVNCTASGGGGPDDYRRVYLEGNRNLIAHLAGSPLKKFVYTSSSSVYGQNDGSVVTENSPTEPESPTAKVLIEVEKLLLAAASSKSMAEIQNLEMNTTFPLSLRERGKRAQLSGETTAANCSTDGIIPERDQRLSLLPGGESQDEGKDGAKETKVPGESQGIFPAVILRVAGIYGPGRGYWFKAFLRGEARIEGDGSRTLNMIHRDDLTGIIIAALERGTPGEIYNAADNEPVSQLQFFEWLAAELKRPMPPGVVADAEVWRKRGVTNKRVSNAKLLAELKYNFQFPDFRAGYGAELKRLAAEGFPDDFSV